MVLIFFKECTGIRPVAGKLCHLDPFVKYGRKVQQQILSYVYAIINIRKISNELDFLMQAFTVAFVLSFQKNVFDTELSALLHSLVGNGSSSNKDEIVRTKI